MTYQQSMFSLEVMQDRTATKSGHLRLPKGMTRGDCAGAAESRARGEQSCPFLTCSYHLVPELVKLRPKGAVNAMAKRLSGKIKHTCALDIADEGPQDHQAIGDALGIDRQHVPQREAEAMFKFKRLVAFNERLNNGR